MTNGRKFLIDTETASDDAVATFVDHSGYTGWARNTHVVVEASRERFVELLRPACAKTEDDGVRQARQMGAAGVVATPARTLSKQLLQ